MIILFAHAIFDTDRVACLLLLDDLYLGYLSVPIQFTAPRELELRGRNYLKFP